MLAREFAGYVAIVESIRWRAVFSAEGAFRQKLNAATFLELDKATGAPHAQCCIARKLCERTIQFGRCFDHCRAA
jgi:hypothetical protein